MRAHGNEVAHGVAALGHAAGQREVRGGAAEVAHRAVAVAEAAAGEADLAEQRGERERGPDRLLAVLRALQRVRHRDERALRGHLARELAQVARGDAGALLRPLRRLRHAVGLAHDVRDELLRAGAAALEEHLVV